MIIGNFIGIGSNMLDQGYSEAVQAYVDKLTALGYTQPDSTFLSALDTFLATSLDTGTVYSRMKTGNIYGFGSIEAGTVNLKDPDSYQHTSPAIASIQYSAGNGVRSDLTANSYFNTQYAVNEYAGIESDLTSVLYVSESSTDTSTTRVAFGSHIDSGSTSVSIRLSPLIVGSGRKRGYGADGNFTSTNHKGLYVLTYDGSNSVIYKDGSKTTQALAPTAPNISNPVLLLAFNSNTAGGISPGLLYNKYVAGFLRFDRFNDADESAFRTAWETLRTAVSLP